MTALEIRTAQFDELDTVEGLLKEASVWLASRGINQWQFPPHRDRITAALHRGEVFLGFLGNQAIATFQLDDHADPEFWSPGDAPSTALYVHRMAVSRTVAGVGIGTALLDWASTRAAEMGKNWLRLDAWKDNPGLHQYYEGNGFELMRIVDISHRGSGALFQRAV